MVSELFYKINFIVSIVASMIGLFVGCLIIVVVIINRQCRSIPNLLMCNSILAMIFYRIIIFISTIYGLGDDWLHYQPACTFRAYCILISSAAICYSYTIQAISRLFFVVFYKHKYLQTYRVHWLMIILSWFISVHVPFVMFLINNNIIVLQEGFRFCVNAVYLFIPSAYAIISVYAIPCSIMASIYGIIFNRARQSTRRVVTFASQPTPTVVISHNAILNMKRELILMTNMMILVSFFTCSGMPYCLLIFWQIVFKTAPPEPLYLISINSITIGSGCMIVITFFMSKEVKKCCFQYVRKFWRN